MNILGIILLIILPYPAGLILNIITRQKETNQIETYLIGFFSLFLLQGGIFSLTGLFSMPFETCCKIFTYAIYGILILGVPAIIFGYKGYIKDSAYKYTLRKEERVMFSLMILAIALIIVRIFTIYGYIRDDIMLETVRVNVMTGTVNAYNPFTARPYELGLINSKKLITLPLYYTYWCETFNIEARVLLYLVVTLQTLLCLFGACQCAMTSIMKTNKKMYTFGLFTAILLLSGDYFKGAVGYKVLWNGYAGETIVVTVMLPYIIYLIMNMYRIERGDYGPKKWGRRICSVVRILLCLCSSVFITGIVTGPLLLVLCLATVIVCCTVRFGREEHGHE